MSGKKDNRIFVLMKDPFMDPQFTWVANSLECMQAVVGGYIEAFTLWNGLTVICCENALFSNMRYNCTLEGHHQFFGTIFITGPQKDGELTSLPTTSETIQIFSELTKRPKTRQIRRKESELEASLSGAITARGGLFYKWVSPGNDGVPDRIAVLPESPTTSRVVFAEMKADGGYPSPLQIYQIKRLTHTGADCRIVVGEDGIQQFKKEFGL